MKKGFTLIEVLGVIVLISLIAVILVPIVSDTLKQGKERVIENSIINYISSVETYLKASALDNNKIELPYNNTYNVNLETVIEDVPYPALNTLVEINGEYPKSGTITIDDNYTVVSAIIVIDNYQIVYNNTNKIVSINPV